MSKAIIYTRSASKNDEAIKKQIEICQNFAKNYGYDVIAVFIDNNYSGSNFKRPGFNAMNKLKGWNTIIVSDKSRIARNPLLYLTYQSKLKAQDKIIADVSIMGVHL